MMTEHTSDNLLIACPGQVVDSSPLNGAVHSLPPITVQVASQSDQESLWDHLVRRHHYLGYQKLLGHRIKVETFANISPIILNGADWFASIGTEKSKGTKVFAFSGALNSLSCSVSIHW